MSASTFPDGSTSVQSPKPDHESVEVVFVKRGVAVMTGGSVGGVPGGMTGGGGQDPAGGIALQVPLQVMVPCAV